jgi:acetylglutamate kinase
MAVGLSGKDGRLITARKVTRTQRDPSSNIERAVDLGFVGEPASIDPHVLDVIIRSDIIPVIAPTGAAPDGQTYNINADTAAGAIASAIKACRFLLLTDVPGVLDRDKNVIPRLSVAEAKALIANGTAVGGMRPKLETCIDAVEAGVEAAVILDGRVPHAILLELLTDRGVGTMIARD